MPADLGITYHRQASILHHLDTLRFVQTSQVEAPSFPTIFSIRLWRLSQKMHKPVQGDSRCALAFRTMLQLQSAITTCLCQMCILLALGAIPGTSHMPTAEPHLGSRMPCQPLYDSPPPQVCGSAFRQPVQITIRTPRAAKVSLRRKGEGHKGGGEKWCPRGNIWTVGGLIQDEAKIWLGFFMSYLTQMEYSKVHRHTLEYCAVVASCRSILANLIWVSLDSFGRLLSDSSFAASTPVTEKQCQNMLIAGNRLSISKTETPPRNQKESKFCKASPAYLHFSGFTFEFPMTAHKPSPSQDGVETTLPLCPQFLKYPSIPSHPPCLHRPQPCLACPGQ